MGERAPASQPGNQRKPIGLSPVEPFRTVRRWERMSRLRIVAVAATTFTMLVVAWGLPASAVLPSLTLGPT